MVDAPTLRFNVASSLLRMDAPHARSHAAILEQDVIYKGIPVPGEVVLLASSSIQISLFSCSFLIAGLL